MNPPVIIAGMHRSGTTLVARLLESFDLFLGAYKDENCESHFFRTINDWILRISGGAWDNPGSIERVLNNDAVRRIVIHHIRNNLNFYHIVQYSGPKHYRKFRRNTGAPFLWGWKDPRNSVTLPIWLDLFPDARIIHVFRHGVDVANSLFIRQKRWYQRALFPPSYRRLRYLLSPFGGHYLRSAGFQNHAEGLNLWAFYMQCAESSLAVMNNRSMALRYEDLLQDPERNIQLMLDFCHLREDSRNLSKALESIDRSKAFAFKKNPELLEFASANSGILAKFGY